MLILEKFKLKIIENLMKERLQLILFPFFVSQELW